MDLIEELAYFEQELMILNNKTKEFKEVDFKHSKSYLDEEDPIKLLKMLEESDPKDLIKKLNN